MSLIHFCHQDVCQKPLVKKMQLDGSDLVDYMPISSLEKAVSPQSGFRAHHSTETAH